MRQDGRLKMMWANWLAMTPQYTYVLPWDRAGVDLFFLLAKQPTIQQSQVCHVPETAIVNRYLMILAVSLNSNFYIT